KQSCEGTALPLDRAARLAKLSKSGAGEILRRLGVLLSRRTDEDSAGECVSVGSEHLHAHRARKNVQHRLTFLFLEFFGRHRASKARRRPRPPTVSAGGGWA